VENEESIAFYLQLVEKMIFYLKNGYIDTSILFILLKDFWTFLDFFGFGRKVFWRNLKNYIQKLKIFPDG